MKDTKELGVIKSKCAWCGKSDGGPWSGMALLGAMKYVHTDCEDGWERSNKTSQKAIGALNDFFGKLMNEKK